nr:hypothetical protein [uncultured Rhodopila sp.]
MKAAAVPEGSRLKGHEPFLVQDLIIAASATCYQRERRVTPDGRTIPAPLPERIDCHFGPELRRFVLMQYHQGQSTLPRLTALRQSVGVPISKRQVQRLLTDKQEGFVSEAREVLRVGHSDYVLNDAACDYMRTHALPATAITRLMAEPQTDFADEAVWLAHLERLGFTALDVTPNPVRVATEGAMWGSVQSHKFLCDAVGLSDDAGQFNVGRHALCWIRAERLAHKLEMFTDKQRAAQARVRGLRRLPLCWASVRFAA